MQTNSNQYDSVSKVTQQNISQYENIPKQDYVIAKTGICELMIAAFWRINT